MDDDDVDDDAAVFETFVTVDAGAGVGAGRRARRGKILGQIVLEKVMSCAKWSYALWFSFGCSSFFFR